MLFWRNRHEVRDEELNAFVDGELEESERRYVERHIESCAACGNAVAELRVVSRAMSELPAVRAPRSFVLREADIDEAQPAATTGLFGSLAPLLSGVAAIAIVAFVVLVGVDIGSNSSQSDSSNASIIALEADGDAARSVSDGELRENDGEQAPSNADAFGDDESVSENEPDSTINDEVDAPLASALPEPAEVPEDESDIVSGDAEGSVAPDDDGDSTGLRVAESVAAAVAIAAGGSVLLIWWRRRIATG